MCNSPQRVYILRGVRRRCVPGLRRGGGRQAGATVLSYLVSYGGVNWTIALNVSRLRIFCRRQS